MTRSWGEGALRGIPSPLAVFLGLCFRLAQLVVRISLVQSLSIIRLRIVNNNLSNHETFVC